MRKAAQSSVISVALASACLAGLALAGGSTAASAETVDPTASATATPTDVASATPSDTATPTASATATPTPTPTQTTTASPTPTPTPTETVSIPVATTMPSISGTLEYNATLTASPGVWTNGDTNALTFAYQWQQHDGASNTWEDIYGATAANYQPVNGVSRFIRVRVVAANSAGSSTAFSTYVTLKALSAPTNTTLPSVTGIAKPGNTLVASPGSWDNASTFTYRWESTSTTGVSSIVGYTNTYMVQDSDAGGSLKVMVSATSTANMTSVATSSPLMVSALTLTDPLNPLGNPMWDGTTPIQTVSSDISRGVNGALPTYAKKAAVKAGLSGALTTAQRRGLRALPYHSRVLVLIPRGMTPAARNTAIARAVSLVSDFDGTVLVKTVAGTKGGLEFYPLA